MQSAYAPITSALLLRLLRTCKKLRPLLQIHGSLIVLGLKTHEETTSTHLINAYSLVQRPELSRSVFDSVGDPGVVLWNSMVSVYTRAGQYKEALEFYRCMSEKGVDPDKYTFTFALKACTGAMDLKEGLSIHRTLADKGFESDVYIGTALVDMYSKVGDLMSARQVFDKMPEKDIAAWNAMVSGVAQNACPREALNFFRDMQLNCLAIDYVSLLNLIPAVSKLGDVNVCRCFHGHVIRKGFKLVLNNGLIDVYCKCEDVYAAKCIFEEILSKDDSSWGTMMSGYAHNGCFMEVVDLFDRMKNNNLRMNKVAAASALHAAAYMGDLNKGTAIHEYVVQQGMSSDALVATSLMSMYAKCGELEKAEQLFRKLKERDVVAWTAFISAFEQAGHPKDALSLFRNMMSDYVKPNAVTLTCVLTACAELYTSRLGKSIHCYAMKAEIDSDMATATAVISMYAKCGFFAHAHRIFQRMPSKDVVAFNALINGYAQIGDAHGAFEVYNKLRLYGLCPDPGTMVGLLPACAILNDLDQGSCIHGQVVKLGFDSECHVEHALIDMYTKCGELAAAVSLFSRYEFKKSTESWNIMITGYLLNGQAEAAITGFRQMMLENFQPNVITAVSVIPAAAQLTALREGMSIHACIIQLGLNSYTAVGNSLINMYAKCGRIEYSEKCFNETGNKNTVSWNTMLAGYAVHGLGQHAVSLFSFMQEKVIEVDSVSFLGVLSACRHAGLVEEGKRLFNAMQKEYNIEVDSVHYACMVDLLGRAGMFDEAIHMMRTITAKPNVGVWGALLSSSRMHSDLQLAESAFCQLVKLEPENPAHYAVLLNNSQERRWDEADSKSSRTVESGIKKIPGCSLLGL